MKINVKSFALACGITWGVVIFLVTWWVIVRFGSSGAKTVLGVIYPGYNISPLGSVIGLLWGFADGLIIGAALAWLYNKLSSGK